MRLQIILICLYAAHFRTALAQTTQGAAPVAATTTAATAAPANSQNQAAADKSAKWSYPAINKNWGGTCNTGKKQSPIDLPPVNAAQAQYALTEFQQYRKGQFGGEMKNNALTWTPTVGQSAVGYFTHEDVKYNFETVTIHAGSEHTLNGKQYDMELQFRHRSDGGQVAYISVLGSVMAFQQESSAFFTALQVATSEGHMVDLNDFFTDKRLDTSRYFKYLGSETTPPCNEDVLWFVLATVASVPEKFYKYVTGANGAKDNYRSPQDLGARKIVSKAASLAEHWHYPASNKVWGGVCRTGRQQSPINLPLTVLSSITKKSQLLNDMDYQACSFKGEETGHGLKFISPSSQNMGHLALNNQKFELEQFNMHSKSEHTIAGEQYDLELHFVHKTKHGETAIVGVLCKSTPFGKSEFFDTLRKAMGNEPVQIDIKKLFFERMDTTRYFRYPGSLTTPPCTEGVNWLLVASQCSVPKDFMIFLKKYKDMKDNFRPAQPLNDRSIETVELEEATADELEQNQTIDLAEIPTIGKIAFGTGLLTLCGVLLFRCSRKDPMSSALLHDVDEV